MPRFTEPPNHGLDDLALLPEDVAQALNVPSRWGGVSLVVPHQQGFAVLVEKRRS